MTYLTKNLTFFSNLDGMQAICAEKVFWEKRMCGHPFSLTAFGRFPFLSLRDIFPRSGGNRPSRGRLCAATAKFPATTKAVPLGKVASPQAMTEGVQPPKVLPTAPLLPQEAGVAAAVCRYDPFP